MLKVTESEFLVTLDETKKMNSSKRPGWTRKICLTQDLCWTSCPSPLGVTVTTGCSLGIRGPVWNSVI